MPYTITDWLTVPSSVGRYLLQHSTATLTRCRASTTFSLRETVTVIFTR
jgi:hypothetical protein